jgi:membrane associated rhomboid family serine protease/Zn-finger nucleic acid-binding protein
MHVPWLAHARRCARCTYPLEVYADRSGVHVDHCYRCGGSFLDFGKAGRVIGEKADPRNWRREALARPPVPGPLFCPAGHGPMWSYLLTWEGRSVEIDACAHCHGLWLDAREAEHLDEITKAAHAEFERPGAGKGTAAQIAVYLVQLATAIPVEVYNPVRRRPVLVYTLVLMLIPLFFLEMIAFAALGEGAIKAIAFVPELFERGYVWQLLSYAFFHGSIPHIAGNLYFLWVFGDNVEDRLGRPRFAILYLVSAVVGALAYWVGNLHGTEPMVGASGAIAGLMGAYLVLFPRVKVWIVFLFIQFKLRAVWYIVIWVVLQLVLQFDESTNVAWLAHIGGFVAGAVLATMLQPKGGPPERPHPLA